MNEIDGVVKYAGEIIKSPEDKRNYRGLELGNKLKILLISDPDTDRAAAAINVHVGNLCDPEKVPGLAHFCEHMLFLGTEKYPGENDYSKYITEHGGKSNAHTTFNYTSYYFDVLPEHLEGALDRFAQFFIAPLFNEDATSREIKAVNSEYEKNVPVDEWRVSQLERHLSKKNHPFNKFGIGNTKTLDVIPREMGINIRDELLKFHKKWYSANIMTLAILGRNSLDELEKLGKSLFLSVQNKNVEKSKWTEHPLGPEHLQCKNYIVPVKDSRSIKVSFPAPDFHEHYKSRPFGYISHLIGHEGSGSLLSALKAKGWCNYLESGFEKVGDGFAFYIIKTDLTEDGIGHVNDIVKLFFQYINMLNSLDLEKWIFEECQQIERTAFRFKEKERPMGYVTELARCMQEYPMEEVLCGPYFIHDWRPDLIKLALSYLKPQSCRINIVSQAFEDTADKVEPWFGTKYKVEKIAPSIISDWEEFSLCEDLKLPNPNEFITSNFEIYARDEKTSSLHPNIILNTQIMRVWYKQDDEFLLPKANIKFEFTSPLAYLDPLNCSMTYMFVQLLKDSINEYAYDAELAGLKWNVTNTNYGLMLAIGGYNDKQGVFLEKILDKMTNFTVDSKRFEYRKEIYVRNLKNFDAEQPYQQSMYCLSLLLVERAWMKEDLLESVKYLTTQRLTDFIPNLLAKLYIQCLIHGNVDKDRAAKIIEIVDNKLKTNSSLLPMLPTQLLRAREIQLVDGTHFKYEMQNPFFSSSCAENYYQCDVLSTKNNMLMELLVQIMLDPCFNILRTKEQLGYIVSCGLRRSNCVQGLRIVVQSNHHPVYVDQRIEAFLIQFRTLLEEMSEKEFESYRESLATVKLEKPKKLSTLSMRYWDEITSYQFHFNRAEVEVAYLRTITKVQLLSFFDEFIRYGAFHRRKLSIYVLAKGGETGETADEDGRVVVQKGENCVQILAKLNDGMTPSPPYHSPCNIDDVTKFKSSHGLYPLAQPHMNVTHGTGKSKL